MKAPHLLRGIAWVLLLGGILGACARGRSTPVHGAGLGGAVAASEVVCPSLAHRSSGREVSIGIVTETGKPVSGWLSLRCVVADGNTLQVVDGRAVGVVPDDLMSLRLRAPGVARAELFWCG